MPIESISALSPKQSTYRGVKDPQTGVIRVMYNDPKIMDEETLYIFNADGSATSQSLAWGNMTECPKGTFSDMLLKLPNTEELSEQTAKQLAISYRDYLKHRPKKNMPAVFPMLNYKG